MRIVLEAKSSSGEPYEVVFNYENDKLNVKCSCPAGIWGKLCKHKTNLLKGDESFLYNQNDKASLSKVKELACNSSFQKLIDTLESDKKKLKKLESEKKKKQKVFFEKLSKSGNMIEFEDFKDLYSEISNLETELAYGKYLSSTEKRHVEKMFKEGF